MNVSLQNIDKVSAMLTIKVEKADYQDQVDKSLKKFRQQAKVPGFRPGMVPMGLIKKMYGKNAKMEEVNKVVADKIFGYIKDEKLNVLGDPLPNEEKQRAYDFEVQDDFEFIFDLALAPQVNFEISKKDKIPYYMIEVSDEMVNRQIDTVRQRGGSYDKVDVYEEGDMIKGLLIELNVEKGISLADTVLLPKYMKNDEQKALFNKSKVGDVITINPFVAYDGSEIELSSFLKIEKETVKDHQGDFTFQITEITRFKMAELNQEVFDSVYEKGTVTTEEDFRAKTKANMVQQYVSDSKYKFALDVRSYMLKKNEKIEFPDTILKKVMKLNNKDKDDKFIDDNYADAIKNLTWSLIGEKLFETYNLKIEKSDIEEVAKEVTRAQFAQYGMNNIPDDMLNNYVQGMLKKEETANRFFDRAKDEKLSVALKDLITIEEKTISLEEFNAFFDKK
jgi:trigger factor